MLISLEMEQVRPGVNLNQAGQFQSVPSKLQGYHTDGQMQE